MNKNLKFKDDDFSDEEKEILYKYPLYFRFHFLSTSMSRFFAFVQTTVILLGMFLLWKSLWIYTIPILLTFFLCAKLRIKLDPLFFKNEEYLGYKKKLNKSSAKQITYGKIDSSRNFYSRMKSKTERELYLMKKIYNQFWNKKEKKPLTKTVKNKLYIT